MRPAASRLKLSRVHHPISYFQAIVLGLTQGIAEPFPISSLGHAVVLPRLFGWNIHQNDKFFLTFLVATHFATALTLLLFFLRDWIKIVGGILRSLRVRKIGEDDVYARLGWLLIVGTVPAGILGLALQESLRKLFASATIAAAFLIVNGIALLLFEQLRKRPPQPRRLRRRRRRRRRRPHRQAQLAPGDRDRHLAGRRADPRHLALGLRDGGQPARGALQRGRGALLLPARHPRDPRRRRAEAARTARLRRATACAAPRSSPASARLSPHSWR